MGIEKMMLLAHESVYRMNVNSDIKNTVQQCATCMEYQETQPCEEIKPYHMPHKSWELVGADIFTIKNNALLCIVDYYSKSYVIPGVSILGNKQKK